MHVASRVQTWAEECVHLHEVLKIEIYIFSTWISYDIIIIIIIMVRLLIIIILSVCPYIVQYM